MRFMVSSPFSQICVQFHPGMTPSPLRRGEDMKSHSVMGCGAVIAAVLMGAEAAADPFDFFQVQYGVNTGVLIQLRQDQYRDGVTLTLPIPTYLQDKNYSAQIVQPGSGDKSESYVQLDPAVKD